MSTYGIGIDFGATTCVVAMSKAGQTDVIPNEMGNRSTAVCVAFLEDGTTTVGDAAYNQKERNLPGTIREFKKLLGQDFEDELTQEDIADCKALKNVEIVQSSSSSSCALKLSWAPEEPIALERIATMVFGKIRETASLYLGEEVSHCVLSVPSHFSEEKAALIKSCCEAVGNVKVMRLVKDPCAAMIAHGLDVTATYTHHRLLPGMVVPNTQATGAGAGGQGRDQKPVNKENVEKTVAVVDLGGTSFDLSVFSVNRNSGLFSQVASVGSGSLGCGKLDELLFDYCVKDLRRKDGKAALALKKDERASLRLKEACEKAKKALSASKRAAIEVEALLGDVDFFTQITREQFEELVGAGEDAVVDSISEMLEEAVEKLGQGGKVDEFLLIGGGCNVPLVAALISDFFRSKCGAKEWKLDNNILCEEAVAMGAAIQADVLLNMCAAQDGALAPSAALETPAVAEDDEDDVPGIAKEGMTLTQAVGIATSNAGKKDFFPMLHRGVPVPVSHKEALTCEPGSFNLEIVKDDGTALASVPVETTHHHVDLVLSMDGKGQLSVSVDGVEKC